MGTNRRLALALMLGLMWTGPQALRAQAQEPEPQQQPAEDADAAIREMLRQTWEIASAGDGKGYAAAWDANTMIKDLLQEPGIAELPKAKKAAFAMGLGMGIRMGLAEDTTIFAYERMIVRSVQVDGDRATAVIRGWDADDFGLTWRIWLANRKGTWGIHDAEELSQGIRISRLMLSAAASTIDDGTVPPWIRQMDTLVAAATASADTDWMGLESNLELIEDVEFPPDLEAMRAMLKAIHALQWNGDPEAALMWSDAATTVYPATIACELVRSRALLMLERPSEVLPATERYLDVTGADATALMLRGEALHALGRHDEAIPTLRAAAEDSPGSADVLATWLIVAEGREHNEPLRVFKTLRNPEAVFEPIVVALRSDGDAEALELLFAACAQVRPDDLDLAYWRSLDRLEDGDVEAARVFLRPAIDLFREDDRLADEDVWPWIGLWLDIHQAAGALAEAAEAYPESVFALIETGLRMVTAGDVERIEPIAARIGELDAENPWPALLRADVALARGEPEKVETLLGPLARDPAVIVDSYLADHVRRRRADAFVAAGKALEGYDAFGGDEAFAWLAPAAYRRGDTVALGQLVARHEKEEWPDPDLLAVFRLHLLYLEGKYPDAVAHYGANEEILRLYCDEGTFDSAMRSAVRSDDLAAAERIALHAVEEVEDYWLPFVRIAQRDPDAARTAVEEAIDYGLDLQPFLDDPDLRDALATEEMAPVRALLETGAAGD